MANDRKLQVRFRNVVQVALYECELKGQISDGNWENSTPFNHWQDPCDAMAVVGKPGESLGPVGFRPRRNYGFGSTFLVECVGSRMLFYARAVQAFPELMKRLDDHWNWEEDRNTFTSIDLDKINAVPYSMKDLKADLNDMSRIWAGKPSKEEEKVAKAKVKAEVAAINKAFEDRQRAESYNHQSSRVAFLRQQLKDEEVKLNGLVQEMAEKDGVDSKPEIEWPVETTDETLSGICPDGTSTLDGDPDE